MHSIFDDPMLQRRRQRCTGDGAEEGRTTLADLRFNKARANVEFGAKRWTQAIEMYSDVLSRIPDKGSFYSHGEKAVGVLGTLRVTTLVNRAQALLNVARHTEAIEDCLSCLRSIVLHDAPGL